MCSPVTMTLPDARSEHEDQAVFADRMLDIFNSGALAIMISLGHRTGLFDTLAEIPPATSEFIARAAGLQERYVREWLAAMVTGGIVTYDPERHTYALPAAHAAWLTRAAAPNNLAVVAQYLPVIASVEDDILECFRNGGGVPYSRFTRFHEVMAEDSGQSVVDGLFEYILPIVPGVRERLEAGIDVLDLGCGRGRALMTLAAAFPASRFTGYDISEDAIDWGRRETQRLGLDNLVLEVRDAAQLDHRSDFDLITTFDAVHDQSAPQQVLDGIHSALRPGGVYLMQDIKAASHVHDNLEHPLAPLLYSISTMHCMTVSLAAGGEGLGTMWGREKALEMLGRAGFSDVEVHELDHDIQNYFYVPRKPLDAHSVTPRGSWATANAATTRPSFARS
jgi:SAM-dependent methyltransferase